jgi:hypothetical protein
MILKDNIWKVKQTNKIWRLCQKKELHPMELEDYSRMVIEA